MKTIVVLTLLAGTASAELPPNVAEYFAACQVQRAHEATVFRSHRDELQKKLAAKKIGASKATAEIERLELLIGLSEKDAWVPPGYMPFAKDYKVGSMGNGVEMTFVRIAGEQLIFKLRGEEVTIDGIDTRVIRTGYNKVAATPESVDLKRTILDRDLTFVCTAPRTFQLVPSETMLRWWDEWRAAQDR